jgi:hypothetical protein
MNILLDLYLRLAIRKHVLKNRELDLPNCPTRSQNTLKLNRCQGGIPKVKMINIVACFAWIKLALCLHLPNAIKLILTGTWAWLPFGQGKFVLSNFLITPTRPIWRTSTVTRNGSGASSKRTESSLYLLTNRSNVQVIFAK